MRAAAVPDVSGPALPFPRPSPAHCIFLHFFLDNSSLHANLLRVTTRLIGPGGGTKAGFPTSRSFGFSGGAPPLHHSIPPWISIRQPDDSSKVQFHLIPLNSTWFHLVPLNSTSRWGGGGGRRSQIHQILIHLYRAQHRSQEKNAFCSADSRVPLRQSAIRNPQFPNGARSRYSYGACSARIAFGGPFAPFRRKSMEVPIHELFTRHAPLSRSSPIKPNQA